jgi:hypothetical protein
MFLINEKAEIAQAVKRKKKGDSGLMYITACHPVSLLRYCFIGLVQTIYLYGETAYRNPYNIPKTTTPVKKIVPISALFLSTPPQEN